VPDAPRGNRVARLRAERDHWRDLALQETDAVRREAEEQIAGLRGELAVERDRRVRAEARLRAVDRVLGHEERRTGQVAVRTVRQAMKES
jgi:hypothetical protein